MKRAVLLITFVILSNITIAQWIQTNGPYGGEIRCFAVSDTNLFAGTYGGGVFLSTNNGTSWTEVNSGLTNSYVYALAVSDTNLFAGTESDGVFISTDNGTSWTMVNYYGWYNTFVVTFAVSGSNIFAGTYDYGVFRSTNNGTNWTEVNFGLTGNFITSLAVSGSNIFAGTHFDGVFRSTNNGTYWTEVNSGLTNTEVLAIALSVTNIFAGTYLGGVFLSTNNGTSWTEANSGLPNNTTITELAFLGTNIFAGTLGSGVWRRPLDEMIPVELTSFTASVRENKVILNWATATETNNQGFEIERKQVGSSQSSVGNQDWNQIAFVPGFGTTTEPKSYSFVDENLSTGKYQYRLKQMDFDGTFEYSNTVEVEITSPTEFSLEQNYPNPFNPSTSISFSISERSFVTLKVYDMLGREIVNLVNEELETGSFEKTFDAGTLSSGVYIYRISAMKEGKILFNESKQMLLIK